MKHPCKRPNRSHLTREFLRTVEQAADELGITIIQVAALIDSGELPHVKVGGKVRVLWAGIERYKNRREGR